MSKMTEALRASLAARNAFANRLERENANLREALSKYARRYNDRGECWNWMNSVCDKYSGECAHFDWMGDEQNEAWEIAETALNRVSQ